MADNITDNEIIEALEEFHHRILKTNLSYYIRGSEMMAVCEALNLINRKNAEIERLKARNNELNALNKTASVEAVRGFADKVNLIVEELVDIMFDDNESKCKISNCHKHSSIPCESPTCIEENKAYWKVRILTIVKEMVGDEK